MSDCPRTAATSAPPKTSNQHQHHCFFAHISLTCFLSLHCLAHGGHDKQTLMSLVRSDHIHCHICFSPRYPANQQFTSRHPDQSFQAITAHGHRLWILFQSSLVLSSLFSDAQSCPPTYHPAPPPGPGNQLARSKPKNTMKTQFTKILTSHPSIPFIYPVNRDPANREPQALHPPIRLPPHTTRRRRWRY
jgi:hypothetical protein